MFVLLVANVVVLSVWTAIDPLHRKTIVVIQDMFLRDVETQGKHHIVGDIMSLYRCSHAFILFNTGICTSDHVTIFIGVLAFINVGSLFVALWQAYLARNVSTDLQESSYIFVAMSMILMVFFMGAPVIIISKDNNDVSYFIRVSVIFAICMSILGMIYVPKLIAFRKRKQQRGATLTRFGSSSLMSDTEGINILWSPRDQQDMEEKTRALNEKITLLKKENEELKQKTFNDSSSGLTMEGLGRRTSLTFSVCSVNEDADDK